MTCIEIKELLSLYIDDMLEPDQAAEVEKHLADCDSCCQEYKELKNIVSILGNIEQLPVPEAFGPRLKQALQQEKRSLSKSINWRIIGSIAAIFAVGILSYGMYNDIMNVVPNKLNTAYEQIGNESGSSTESPKEMQSALNADEAERAVGAEAEVGEDVNSDLNKNLDPDSTIVFNNQSLMASDSSAGSKIMDTNVGGGKDSALSNGLDSYEDVDVNATSRAFQDHSTENIIASDNPGMAFKQSGGRHFLTTAPETSNFKEALSPEANIICDKNTAAIKYYTLRIEDKLAGFDYQILNNCYNQNGEWQFRVFIFTGKDGNTYNQEIRITGKNGEIKVENANEFMGL